MFFFTLSLDLSFNALFFTESIQTENYKSNGNLNFLVTFPSIIYSSVVSLIISAILSFISSFDPIFKKIKEDKEHCKTSLSSFFKNIKCKLVMFFIIVTIFTLFFWYFVTAFCAVFPKYQKLWLSDGIKSLVISMIFPFFYTLLIAFLRWISLKKHVYCMFCIANIICMI